MTRYLSASLAICLSGSLAHAAGPATPASEDSVSGTRSHAATFEVDFRVAIATPPGTKQLRVWLPVPPNLRSQSISDRQFETFPTSMTPSLAREPMFGNRFAYFEFASPGGQVLIRHRFTATIEQVDWNVDYADVATPDRWPASFDVYRRIDPRAQSEQPLLGVLEQINRPGESSSDRLINAIEWIDANLTYDHAVASLTADPMHGLIHRRGHCSDYHGLCSTLAQKIGYPSRVLYGLQMFDKPSPSHCKLEVFLPPYGWVTFDLSETQKLVARIAEDTSLSQIQRAEQIERVKQRTMRGFRENTWLEMTRGTNYTLAPPASEPVPLVRTIHAEADGVALVGHDPYHEGPQSFSFMTIYHVDESNAARRFQQLPSASKIQVDD